MPPERLSVRSLYLLLLVGIRLGSLSSSNYSRGNWGWIEFCGISNVLLNIETEVRVDPSLGLSIHRGVVVFDDLSNGSFSTLLSTIREHVTC